MQLNYRYAFGVETLGTSTTFFRVADCTSCLYNSGASLKLIALSCFMAGSKLLEPQSPSISDLLRLYGQNDRFPLEMAGSNTLRSLLRKIELDLCNNLLETDMLVETSGRWIEYFLASAPDHLRIPFETQMKTLLMPTLFAEFVERRTGNNVPQEAPEEGTTNVCCCAVQATVEIILLRLGMENSDLLWLPHSLASVRHTTRVQKLKRNIEEVESIIGMGLHR